VKALAAAVLALFLCAGEADALGSDHPAERIAAEGKTCVHGYWVNQTDVFFHAGNTADFNAALAALAKQPKLKIKVVVHAGTTKARSPWDKADRTSADWSVTTGGWAVLGQPDPGDTVQIDVWVGGNVKEADVKYPPGTDVSAAK
jgi:hypothetical protein